MKYVCRLVPFPSIRPLPAWGAWIEITQLASACMASEPLPAWGAWIEINEQRAVAKEEGRRSPHGERGLKFLEIEKLPFEEKAAPRMGSVD